MKRVTCVPTVSRSQEKRIKTEGIKGFNQVGLTTLTLDGGIPVLGTVGSLVTDSHGNHQIIQIQNEVEMADSSVVSEEDMQTNNGEPETDLANGIIAQHMDITEPLTTLRSLLEQRLGFSLSEYTFYLQDAQELDDSKNLVHQCVQGEGLVQVNVEITEKDEVKKINIVDVLKPAEEIVTVSQEPAPGEQVGEPPVVRKLMMPGSEEAERVTRWVASPEFRQEQDRLKIPTETTEWKPSDVLHWIEWSVSHFGLLGVKTEDWKISGKELCELSHADFVKKVPCDPSDLFWTHLELLRKCNIVAVVQQPSYTQPLNQIYTIVTKNVNSKSKTKGAKNNSPRVAYEGCPGNRSGNNGQIQLWQFLLEMLTDYECCHYIQWIGVDGEFKLINPEMVAQLWGQRKNKPTMNYEKLSRALRYYYDGDMIAKVHGKRFVYKFVCDLKSLLGYSAAELKRLVNGCESRSKSSGDILGSTVAPFTVEMHTDGLVVETVSS